MLRCLGEIFHSFTAQRFLGKHQVWVEKPHLQGSATSHLFGGWKQFFDTWLKMKRLHCALASARIRGFSEKKRLNAHGFSREFLRSGMLYRHGKSLKRRGKTSSLHSKKFFLLGGCVFFCLWRHTWRTFRPHWPTLPGSWRQPLGGSISLKFLLETRLQAESFDTLHDLLGFRVQKLWYRLVKIFD